MTKSQVFSLRRFDDEWRSLPDLKRRGVEVEDIQPLIDDGFVEARICGACYYRITSAGWREARKQREG